MPLLHARMVITLWFFFYLLRGTGVARGAGDCLTTSFFYAGRFVRLIRLFLLLTSAVLRLLVLRLPFFFVLKRWFVFVAHLVACPRYSLLTFFEWKSMSRHFRVYRRQVRDAWGRCASERETPFHHRFCIQTYAKGREFCFGFLFFH